MIPKGLASDVISSRAIVLGNVALAQIDEQAVGFPALRHRESAILTAAATGWSAGVEIGLRIASLDPEGGQELLSAILGEIQRGDQVAINGGWEEARRILVALGREPK